MMTTDHMTDRPIIFSGPMVKALIDGRKTQTRRIIKPQPEQNVAGLWVWPPDWVKGIKRYGVSVQTDEAGLIQTLTYDPARCVGYATGDRLWVREGWRTWVHLPLIVTDVRVQRLQAISAADAVAEGCLMDPEPTEHGDYMPAEIAHEMGGDVGWDSARDWFADLWDSLHGPDAWDANPWVAAISFTVQRLNIDEATT